MAWGGSSAEVLLAEVSEETSCLGSSVVGVQDLLHPPL